MNTLPLATYMICLAYILAEFGYTVWPQIFEGANFRRFRG